LKHPQKMPHFAAFFIFAIHDIGDKA